MLAAGALKAVESERTGAVSADTAPVVGLVASLTRLGALQKKTPLELYQRDLEEPVLRETSAFYARESEGCIAARGVTAYLEQAEARLDEELTRGRRLFDPSSLDALRRVCCQSLADRHAATVVSECGAYLEANDVTRLNRAFRLLRLCTFSVTTASVAASSSSGSTAASEAYGVQSLRGLVEAWLTRRGLSTLGALPPDEREDPQHFVDTLLAIYAAAADLVVRAFENDHQFVAALDAACRKIVNDASSAFGTSSGPSRAPEFLARYCDLLLRRGSVPQQPALAAKATPAVAPTTAADATPALDSASAPQATTPATTTGDVEGRALEEQLSRVVTVFRYVDDRDVFQKFYSRLLARRLITGASCSDDAEAAMIAGLKQVCGFEYVNRLTRMFNDMTISSELSAAFRDAPGLAFSPPRFDFSVNVLTSGFWPLQAATATSTTPGTANAAESGNAALKLPADVERCVAAFTSFYAGKHQGRKLQWLHHLGRGELRCASMKRPYELQLAALPMLVLLAFNDSEDALSASDVELACGIVAQDVSRMLRSLADSKLLMPTDSGKFVVNGAFASRRIKVRIAAGVGGAGAGSSAAEKPKDSETAAEYKGLEEDRKMYLQAAIVRVMKARKELRHVQLVQEVITQARARFVPSVASIKRCIETLIEKEFLRRVDGQSDRYAYIA